MVISSSPSRTSSGTPVRACIPIAVRMAIGMSMPLGLYGRVFQSARTTSRPSFAYGVPYG